MDSLGVWLMLAFWASAIGGILFGVSWYRAKRHNPASRDLIEKSLRERLESGELTQSEFERRLQGLDRPQ